MTPDSSQWFEDITREVLKNGYSFESQLFSSERFIYKDVDGKGLYYNTTTFNGILGKNYARIEIFINPKVERTDSLTFKVYGKSKVKNNICDFTGDIRIEHIYHIWERKDDPDSPDSYFMVCNYLFKEDAEQYGTGLFQGTYSTFCHLDQARQSVCLDIDLGGGAYKNTRIYVGIWYGYKSKVIKKCIWSDYRLPYTFDFDIGNDGMVINPKYNITNGNSGD